MRLILTFTLFLLTSFCVGQFAVVHDKDSLLNVREDGSKNSNVIDRLGKGQLVYCFESKGNWTNIDYTIDNNERNGYIYKNRYRLISSFPAFTISAQTTTSITLKKDAIVVTLRQCNFDKDKHTFTYVAKYPKQIEFIDNQRYWGTDGGMPNTEFENIRIDIGAQTIPVPKSALKGLYEPNLNSAKVNYDAATDSLYIQTENGDGAGGYFVIWKIEKGVYKDRLVVYGF